ncbi:MAG: polysaccharide deacetylase [Actinobacteria bacterium QS_5_72_10]|nr:MAG: polysaccharide deacetylase [Actinobacteria bacterium QS_5_72_10]
MAASHVGQSATHRKGHVTVLDRHRRATRYHPRIAAKRCHRQRCDQRWQEGRSRGVPGMDLLAAHRVVAMDQALAELAAGDERPKVVLTFDDGFADVHETAWPLLAARDLPFTVYLASAYMGGQLRWEGSTAAHPGRALSWPQVCELIASGLCTVGNHTHTHVAPEALTEAELDACTAAIESHTGVTPLHFAYPWGVAQTSMEPALRSRFRSAATAEVGRNRAGIDAHRLRRVPVRATDPIEFFAAKLAGHLMPERAYGAAVALAKRAGVAT